MYINKIKVKSLAVIILAAALIFSLFTACNKSPAATPNPSASKSPVPGASPGVSAKPTQTEPVNITLPTSSVDAVHVTGLAIDKEIMEVAVGQSFTLTVGVEPDKATRKTIIWASGNEAVATVSKTNSTTANVTAVSAGTVLIKAASEDSGKIAVCVLTVRSVSVDVTSISLSNQDLLITLGTTFQITSSVQPSNATNKGLTWTSSTPSVAMASDDGTITAIGIGTAVITVKSSNGKTATCNVRVIEALTGISISPTAQSLKIGGTITLNASVLPAGAVKPKLLWSTSNASVATVSDGVVTGKGVGEAVISVKTEDGKFSAYSTVYVSR